MHPRKKQYATEVYYLVSKICNQLTDDKMSPIPKVLNISKDDMLEIIKKIMIALPDAFFYNATPTMIYDMIAFISTNLILFQVQENIDEEEYPYHLIDFINQLTLGIANRYYPEPSKG